nr:serine/threonine-protein kinase [Pseudomarimonas arenosa]
MRELIGEGGMSVVFRAERGDGTIERQVAIKFLRLAQTPEQLLTEARAVSSLRHPNVVSLLDVGRWREGIPYLVLELVSGRPLNTYIAQQRPALQRRLQLWLQVADAVACAHRHFIAHRDIKPGNVLVDDDGQPRLLDFGIARALSETAGSQVDLGAGKGTPYYAAPEMLLSEESDYDAAQADQFALGVLLAEMLLDERPPRAEHDGSALTSLRSVWDGWGEQRRQRQLAHLGGFAHWTRHSLRCAFSDIVHRATQVEPARRYSDVSALIDDMRAWQEFRPLRARPRGAAYRAVKWLLRNRWASVGALLLAVGAGAFQLNTWRLQQQTLAALQVAEAQRQRATTVNQVLMELLTSADPGESGQRDISLLQSIERSAPMLDQALRDEPELEVTLRLTLGTIYRTVGLFDRADASLQRALLLLEARAASLQDERRLVLLELGRLREDQGEMGEAEAMFRAALGDPTLPSVDEHWAAVEAADALAARLARRAAYDEARAWFLRADSTSRKLIAKNGERDTLAAAANHHARGALVAYLLGELSLSEQRAELALGYGRRAYGERSLQVANILVQRAQSFYQRGDYARTEADGRVAMAIFAELLGEAHPKRADAAYMLGQALKVQGHDAEAEQLYTLALSIRRHQQGADHPEVARILTMLTYLLYDQGRAEEAQRASAESLRIFKQALGETNPLTLQAEQLNALSMALDHNADFVALDARMQSVNRSMAEVHGRDNYRNGYTLRLYARFLLWHRRRPDLSLPVAERAIEVLAPHVRDGEYALIDLRLLHTESLIRLGRTDEAIPLFELAFENAAPLLKTQRHLCAQLQTIQGLLGAQTRKLVPSVLDEDCPAIHH